MAQVDTDCRDRMPPDVRQRQSYLYDFRPLELILREGNRCVCRKATKIHPHPDKVHWLYDRLRAAKRHTVWSDLRTINQLLDPTNFVWQLDDVGILVAAPIDERKMHVHVLFWDGRLRGREPVGRYLMAWLVENLWIEEFYTVVPREYPATRAFAVRVGFRPERDFGDRLLMKLPAAEIVNYIYR